MGKQTLLKRIVSIFLAFVILLNNNLIVYADGETYATGDIVQYSGVGDPVFDPIYISIPLYKLMACDENNETVFGPVYFINDRYKDVFGDSANNIKAWPLSQKTNDNQRVFWSQTRTFNFEQQLKTQFNADVIYVNKDTTGVGSFGSSGALVRTYPYEPPTPFGTYAIDSTNHITGNFKELMDKLGLYTALGLTRGNVTVTTWYDENTHTTIYKENDVEVARTQSHTVSEKTETLDSLEAWVRGYDQAGKMKDQKPYICICELQLHQTANERYYWKNDMVTNKEEDKVYKLDRTAAHEYQFKEPMTGQYVISKDEGITSQSAYNNALAKAATDTTAAALVAQLDKAKDKLGSSIKNTGIVSGWMLVGSSSSNSSNIINQDDPISIVANIDIKNSLEMVLFEDELCYNYSLLSSGGITLQAEGQSTNKPIGNKVINIKGSVTEHAQDDICHEGQKLSGCDEKITIDTTLSLNRTFNIVDRLCGFMFPNSGILGDTPASTTAEIEAKNSEGKDFSLQIREDPQGTVNTYYFGGLRDPYYMKLDQRVEGFRTIWQDLRTLWPIQTDTNAAIDMNRIKVIVGQSQYQNLPGGGSDYYLNKYTGAPGTLLNTTHNGSLTEPWSLTWTSTLSPTEAECTGTYEVDGGCHEEEDEEGKKKKVHEHEDEDCEAVLTLEAPDMNDMNNLSNKTFIQYYEVGEANVGSEIVPKQSTYKNFNRLRNKNIRVTVYEYN